MSDIRIEGSTLTTTHSGCEVVVQMAKNDRDRWVPVEVTIKAVGGVSAEALRTIPLRAIEATANGGQARAALELGSQFDALDKSGLLVTRRRPSLKLSVPAAPGRKPDAFYQRVASAYEWLATQGRDPAARLAAINEVPVTTVHRWVKEARARGLLAPGQTGRAT